MARTKLQEAAVEPVDAPACANCAAELVGPYCHACGQKAQLHHKLGHLLEEMLEGVAHFDGRMWRTLPLLAFNPGRLSRLWREGRRASFVPPLHVFLFAVFLVFLVPSLSGQHVININEGAAPQVIVRDPGDGEMPAWAARVQAKAEQAFQNREYYGYKIETLAYKLSFMVVPISMGILWLLTLFPRRGFTLYDHAVVALYGVGFLALGVTVSLLLPALGGLTLTMLVLVMGAHAVAHLKGAYGLSWPGAMVRGFLLGVLSAIGFLAFLLGVAALGLAG